MLLESTILCGKQFHIFIEEGKNEYKYQGVTNCCQISYTPTEILFEINEITRLLKSKIKKIGIETSKIL